EKWDALDVVPVKMRKKNMRAQRLAVEFLCQLFAQDAKSGAAIKDVDVAVDANLHAGSVAAIAQIFRLRRGRGSANAPKADLQRSFHRWRPLPLPEFLHAAHSSATTSRAPMLAKTPTEPPNPRSRSAGR